MRKKYFSVLILGLTALTLSVVNSCATSSSMAWNRSGAQLWGENCLRCHNSPSPETFSDTQWDAIVLHMQVRANLTSEESKKIVEFLKTAN
jgi:cytochrome c1